ncbi:DUF2264 domain-containing protein [Alkalibacterium iburiense]|uniref:DUF2264 domain-containing protein n=1 Tax=Alkalibacterium iburiense TaxID=290589 RepID=A0ABN0X6W0_9LACT
MVLIPSMQIIGGDLRNYDQKIVELSAIGYSLLLAPDTFWNSYTNKEKEQIGVYLRQINKVEAFDCNWLFFAVIVNIGLKNVGEEFSQEVIDRNLNRIDSFYIGEGWYKDGDVAHIDYYVSFAIHFYSLVYAWAMEKEDPKRSRIYKERAQLFMEDFIYWFSEDGQGLPYGRSMTYRFSQIAFFTAYILADVDREATGWIKGIIMRHFRYWFKQPLLNGDGTLSVGYTYPNLNMSENYNSPGSPYWGLKSFLPLAFPADHLFWKVEEEAIPTLESNKTDSTTEQTICRKDGQVVLFPSGYFHTNDHNHVEAKYEKFAYSTHFGFSVPRSLYSLSQGAFDSMLALSFDGEQFMVKRKVLEKEYTDDYIYMKWQPNVDVTVETWIIPGLPWHARIHKIHTEKELLYADHGFSLNNEGNQERLVSKDQSGLLIKDPTTEYVTGAKNLGDSGTTDVLYPNSNTNLLYPNTSLAYVKGNMSPGTHTLIHAFFGDVNNELNASEFDQVSLSKDSFTIHSKEINLSLLDR